MNSVRITGGTGSLGRALIRHYLTTPVARIAILSRDEWKQAMLAKELTDDRIRWFLGDVRDPERLEMAFHGIDTVIHAAALKRIDRVAYDPSEVIKTNVIGTQNVIHAAIKAGVKKMLVVSSDKAVEPTNIYGASKMCAEWLAVMSNVYSYPRGTRVSVVRYGNVIGSRGSVAELWEEAVKAGLPIQITDERCTRFFITMPQAVQFIEDALVLMDGGEIFVPDLPSMRITDLADAVAPGHARFITDLRPGGEKLHEKLLNAEEATRTGQCLPGGMPDTDIHRIVYIIKPALNYWGGQFLGHIPVPPDWVYSSDRNTRWLSVEDMRTLLAQGRN